MFEPTDLPRLTGSEPLTPDGACVADFWRWGYSDLRSNVVRGVLAEYLVARACGTDLSGPRAAWDDYDVLTGSGTKVEVKSSAYLQSWKQQRLSTISFGRLRARTYDETAGRYSGEPRLRADVYVFALHRCTVPAEYDPLDVGQWAFHVLSADAAAVLPEPARLPAVTRHAAPVPWADLAAAVSTAATGRRT